MPDAASAPDLRWTVALALPDPPLADDVVLLRPWAEEDLGCVREASEDPAIHAGTTVPAHFTPAAGRAFIARQHSRLTDGEGISLAIVDRASDNALGLVVLLFRREPGVAGLGYWVIPRARNGRLATRAVALLSRWALRDGGIECIEALVDPGNAASRAVLAANGFRSEPRLPSRLGQPGDPAGLDRFVLVAGDVDSR
jgi:RimJ/RimL family protein N-acetyltransferase